MDLDQIKQELTEHFTEYTFFHTWRLTGKCVVAKKSKYHGADIFVKGDKIVIEPGIPDWTTRLILGAGAAYKKMTDKNYDEVAREVQSFLSRKYEVSIRT